MDGVWTHRAAWDGGLADEGAVSVDVAERATVGGHPKGGVSAGMQTRVGELPVTNHRRALS